MLNATCLFEDPLYVVALHWATSFFAIPIYGVSVIILLFKCPKYFAEYRNHVIVHIISGALQDFHLRIIWKVSIHLPWAAMCSNGFLAEYAVNSFQIFVILLAFTGVSALSLFIYRMEAATKHMENKFFGKSVIFFRNLFYAGAAVVMVCLVLIYWDMKGQKEYKMEMEQRRGTFPDYMWCDNCYFMQFDSKTFLFFYALAYCSVVCAFMCGLLASIETLRALYSQHLRLSAKTAAIQKNFMFSLIVAIIVHITLIFVPLAFHFIASFTILTNEYIAPLLVLLIQNHGSVSTFTMVITNKLLRKAVKKLFLMPENLIRRSEPKVFERKQKKKTSGVHILAVQ